MRGRGDRSDVSDVFYVGLPDLIAEAHVMGLNFPPQRLLGLRLGVLGATARARLGQLGGQEGHLRARSKMGS
jgi:hypothetical protein